VCAIDFECVIIIAPPGSKFALLVDARNERVIVAGHYFLIISDGLL
jgi:hypothetical protein